MPESIHFIRVALPYHLRNLAHVDGDVTRGAEAVVILGTDSPTVPVALVLARAVRVSSSPSSLSGSHERIWTSCAR